SSSCDTAACSQFLCSFFLQAEDGIRYRNVTGVQTCALPISSSPTYPASVRDVASAIANGTFKIRANVCASNVLPLPVGPIIAMLLFANSTSSLPFDELTRL